MSSSVDGSVDGSVEGSVDGSLDGTALTASEREHLARHGFVHLPGRVDRVAALALGESLAPFAGAEGPYGVIVHNVWESSDAFAAFLREGSLAALARDALEQREVVLFQDHAVWKPPGGDVALAWHQDYSYWPLSAPRGITCWLALDDGDDASGCLRYLPGTHREGERSPAEFFPGAVQPAREGLPPLDVTGREAEAVRVPVTAGDVLLHHPLVWHMSPPNHSQRHRRAYSTSWIAPDVTWDPGHAPHPFLWQLRPRPEAPVEGPRFLRFG